MKLAVTRLPPVSHASPGDHRRTARAVNEFMRPTVLVLSRIHGHAAPSCSGRSSASPFEERQFRHLCRNAPAAQISRRGAQAAAECGAGRRHLAEEEQIERQSAAESGTERIFPPEKSPSSNTATITIGPLQTQVPRERFRETQRRGNNRIGANRRGPSCPAHPASAFPGGGATLSHSSSVSALATFHRAR